MPKFNKISLIFGLICLLISCEAKTKELIFETKERLTRAEFSIDKQYLAEIEAIHCGDSLLVVGDYHSGQSFSLFDRTGEFLGRFGAIGQAPSEIPQGCFGSIIGSWFYIHDSSSLGFLAKYSLVELKKEINAPFEVVTKFKSPSKFIFISDVLPVNDSLFLSAGLYVETAQFFLYDLKSSIVGYGIESYNDHNKTFGFFQKALANQGKLRKHPTDNKFVYFVRNSSNLDFIEITGNEIKPVKLQRERNPKMKPVQNGTIVSTYPDETCQIGYLDISVGGNYVYVLHSNKEVSKAYCSNIVRVFDWHGNPAKLLELDREVYYMTVDEEAGLLYAAAKDAEKGWEIVAYRL